MDIHRICVVIYLAENLRIICTEGIQVSELSEKKNHFSQNIFKAFLAQTVKTDVV